MTFPGEPIRGWEPLSVQRDVLQDLSRRADDMEDEADLLANVNPDRAARLRAKADGVRIAVTEMEMTTHRPHRLTER